MPLAHAEQTRETLSLIIAVIDSAYHAEHSLFHAGPFIVWACSGCLRRESTFLHPASFFHNLPPRLSGVRRFADLRTAAHTCSSLSASASAHISSFFTLYTTTYYSRSGSTDIDGCSALPIPPSPPIHSLHRTRPISRLVPHTPPTHPTTSVLSHASARHPPA